MQIDDFAAASKLSHRLEAKELVLEKKMPKRKSSKGFGK
jgi:hypothetical protein